jgi:NADPH2:quinone reductase
MKAMLSHAPGGPDTLRLESVADPTPKAGEAVIDVKACGVNFPDFLIIQDKYQFKPQRPFSPGSEVSGIVASVGEGVTVVKPGDRVLGSAGWGGMAEKLVIEAWRCVKIPDAMPYDVASALMLTYGTSQHALKDRAKIKAGETLLVLGAAGGVGLAAVELGKAYGARVIGAVSTKEKADFVKSRGADDCIVYPSGPFDKDGTKALADLFKQACGKHGADVIYDGVGGDYCEASLRAIAWEGRLLVVGFPAGIPKLPLNLALLKGCDILGIFWGDFVRRFPEKHNENVRELMAFYSEGKVRPHVSETFPLEKSGDAITWLASRKAMGKVVVTVG